MQPYSAETLRDSTVNWAVWKALDMLRARFVANYAAQTNLQTAGTTTAQEAVDPVALAQASRQLADLQSPVLRALTAIWAQCDSAPDAGLAALSAQLNGLSNEEGLVVLAVLAQALQRA